MRPVKTRWMASGDREPALDRDVLDHHVRRMRRSVKANGNAARQRSGSIQMRPVGSSSIEAAGYDRERQALRVRYVGGSTYDYVAVPDKVFKKFLDAASKGRFVNWSIKPLYQYIRVR